MAFAKLSGCRKFVRIFDIVVAMHPDRDLVLFGHRRDARHHTDSGGRGDHFDPQRLRHLKPAVDLRIREVVPEAEIESEEPNAGVIELLADRLDFVQRDGQAPFAEFFAIDCASSSSSLGAWHRSRLDVRRKQLALTDTVFDHGLDSRVQRAIAIAVGLHANLHPAHFGVDLCQRRSERQAGHCHFSETTSGVHAHALHSIN